jgi:hypothetical protein|tara:strand:- start:225 stop:686 length:462 start_codon:yes stop_codon:yes gene_type:complete
MNNFYNLIDTIKQLLSSSEFNNKVTFGDITEVDLGKLTNFPLVHMIIDEAVINERTIDYTLRIIAADIVDLLKEDITDNDYYGNNNMQDILNTQMGVLTRLINQLRRLDLVDNNYLRVEGGVTATPFLDRFENELAGWEATMVITGKNDISIC